jgi:hypothetical protein
MSSFNLLDVAINYNSADYRQISYKWNNLRLSFKLKLFQEKSILGGFLMNIKLNKKVFNIIFLESYQSSFLLSK